MDEIQLTCYGEKLYLWGISSNPKEQFTPQERLRSIVHSLFPLQEWKPAILQIEIPALQDSIIVPQSLKLPYGQYGEFTKAKPTSFNIGCAEISLDVLLEDFLLTQKQRGFSFGDSYEGMKNIVKFAYCLVARQRFILSVNNERSFFLANLDHNDDFLLFKEICEDLPEAVKPKDSMNKEEAVRKFLESMVHFMITNFLKDIKMDMPASTKSDLWIRGFFEPKVKVDQEVAKGISEWVIARNLPRMHEYALLFKLEEPQKDGGPWKLKYAIQSKKDLSIIIGLKEIWENKKTLPLPNYKLYLIQELGMAAKFSKTIENSMLKPNPSAMLLSEEDALSFIKTESFILQDFGFIVQIPKITNAKLNALRVVLNLKKPKTLKVEGTSMLANALFDFDYEIAIGDDIALSKEEFYNLSKLKSHLVNVNGKWIELNSEDVKKVLAFIEKKKQISLADAITANASGAVEFEVEVRSFPEELGGAFFDLGKLSQERIPREFCGELRDYQKKGYSWLILLRNLGFGGILADDMGLGKTIQAIAYILFLKAKSVKPFLIVAPTSVIGNWQHELLKFAPTLKVCLYHGTARKKKSFEEQIKGYDIIITSYGTLRRDRDLFMKIAWDTIILDEAQNIKNPYTQQTIAVARLSAQQRLCLTGTPIENRLSELWSLMDFTNKGVLASWEKFKTFFAEPIELEASPERISRLKKIITPFILRRLKTDKSIINDLPEKTEIKEYCTLTEEQATLYQAIVDESLKRIKESPKERRMHILATIIKLKQVCNHPTNFLKDTKEKILGRSGKLQRLCELVGVFLENNEKCLIFSQFKEMGDILKQTLEEYFSEQVLFLHGQVNRKERECMINLFQNEASPRIFVLSLKAGGTGINLTAANQVIHFDRWWNPAVENQATDRVYRIGQEQNVFIYKFITSGTIEERIDDILESKSALSGSLLSQGETVLTELDEGQLREIFALRRESFL